MTLIEFIESKGWRRIGARWMKDDFLPEQNSWTINMVIQELLLEKGKA